MRLKQISLQGYKTFASKTVFGFEEGITAIVGPNGSGKSNIADALRWVLGEQSFRTLRGQRSTDMIFSGSQNRPRAGMAQAVLALDNSDNWLPIDFSEVEIGRRVYRSGENEYLLNGQKVRLRDVQELLSKSGLAERTYTIIGQGLIDQALSLRSEERRALFEEAAGISHYKARRGEAIRRLEETQHNLERVHDILAEINPRLSSLRRQARRAQDYEQVAADLRHWLRIWYGFNWAEARRRMQASREQAEQAETEWRESRHKLMTAQQQAEQSRRLAMQLQQESNQLQIERERVREQMEQTRRQVAILSEREKIASEQLAAIARDMPELQAQYAEAQAALATAIHELEEAQENLAQKEAALSQFNKSFAAQQEEINRTSAEIGQLEQELTNARKQYAQGEGKLSQLRERLQERPSDEGRATDLAALATETAGLVETVRAEQERLDGLDGQRIALQAEEAAVSRALQQMRLRGNELYAAVNEAGSELARLEARREMLDSLREQAAPDTEGLPVLGRLASLIVIPPEHQTAIAAALGARLGAVILPDEEALWALIARHDHDRPLMAIAAAGSGPTPNGVKRPADDPDTVPDGAIGWARSLVSPAAKIEPLAALLFGDVLLAGDRGSAYRLARELPAGTLVVAPDGFIVHAGGLVEYQPLDPQRNILVQEKAWREAGVASEAQRAKLDALRSQLQELQETIRQQQQLLDDKKEEERRIGRQLAGAAAQLQAAQRKLDRANQQRQYLQVQEETNRKERERLLARIAEMEALMQQRQAEVAQLSDSLRQVQEHMDSLPVAEARQQRQDLRDRVESARTILAGRGAVVQSRQMTLQQIESQLRRQETRLAELRNQPDGDELAAGEQRIAGSQQELERLDSAMTPLRARSQENDAMLVRLEATLSAEQRAAHEQETGYTQSKIAVSQQENYLEGLADRIRADLGMVALQFDEEHLGQAPLPLADIVEELPLVIELPEGAEESVRRYRGQLQRMGVVNMEAPREYEETLERSEFLTRQVADLNRTERQLREVISDLDALTSEAFAATVETVNDIFSAMFGRLFGGGSARLALTEPDDLTVSGVDIFARLPQRRQQSLALLSGGERALTAAALIFSLLKVNPPPFCVMDETDAMLDEVNITRFREVLCELADATQVIVITHNRGTVQAAKTVYGISMAGDSTSQVISIRPEDYLNHHHK